MILVAGGCVVGGSLACQFGEDLDACAGSDAVGSGMKHGGGVGQGADAAGGFDPGTISGNAAEDSDVVDGGSTVGEAGAGFEEVGSGGEGDLGGAEFFFKGKEAGLEDDFDDRSGGVGEFGYTVDVVEDGFVVAGLAGFKQADVEDHVYVVGALFEDADGLVALGAGEGCSQGEADDDADGYTGSGEGGGGDGDPGGVDHGAGEAMLGGFVADLEDLGAGGVGFEEGVVEDGGEVLSRGQGVGGEGCGVERGEGGGHDLGAGSGGWEGAQVVLLAAAYGGRSVVAGEVCRALVEGSGRGL